MSTAFPDDFNFKTKINDEGSLEFSLKTTLWEKEINYENLTDFIQFEANQKRMLINLEEKKIQEAQAKLEKIKKEVELKDHKVAFEYLVKELLENNIVKSLEEIKGIGNRVVQGGSYFDKTEKVDEEVISKIDELSALAPLHNPAAIVGIRAEQEVIPNALLTVVFDTAFHQTISEENYLYALPYEWNSEYKIRRYGAHGTSHKYITLKTNEILGRNDTKLITCHIGNGASISAVKNSKCVNTSMGLTPNAGLIMGSRCGDIAVSYTHLTLPTILRV